MNFKPFGLRKRTLDFNARKKAAFERKQQKQAEALPLFAEQVRAGQHSWQEEQVRRQTSDDAILERWRGREAALWRKARAMYFALPDDVRAKCKAHYDRLFRGAWTPTNLIYVVESFNGVGEERRAKMKQEFRESEARINAMLMSRPALI